MAAHITLKEYLKRLEVGELDRPEAERRQIPTITELADAVGVSREAMSKLANDNRKMLNLDIVSAVVRELRRRGFSPEPNDLMAFRANGEESGRGELAPTYLELL